jgi:hypothetical protein
VFRRGTAPAAVSENFSTEFFVKSHDQESKQKGGGDRSTFP